MANIAVEKSEEWDPHFELWAWHNTGRDVPAYVPPPVVEESKDS